MKSMYRVLLVLSLSFLGLACQSEEQTEPNVEHKEHSKYMKEADAREDDENIQRKELSTQVQGQLRGVYRSNSELYQLFVDENYEEVKKQAEKVAQSIEKIENEDVAQLLDFTKKNLRDLGGDLDVDVLQEAYSMISTALIHVLKTYDIGPGYNAYYCPMVEKRWIQNSLKVTQIQNPYDKSMRQCGDQETSF